MSRFHAKSATRRSPDHDRPRTPVTIKDEQIRDDGLEYRRKRAATAKIVMKKRVVHRLKLDEFCDLFDLHPIFLSIVCSLWVMLARI